MKFRYIVYVFFLSLMNVSTALGAPFVQLDEAQIEKVKTSLENQTASEPTLAAYHGLIKQADLLLDSGTFSVTHKSILAPTKDQHDYLSISRYWWPDAGKDNGLPWIRKDGQTNPDTQTDKVDRKRIGEMAQAVENLGQAYYFSNNEAYAKKGTELIRAWFLDPETRMNPNLNYAQTVPGINKQRRSGILDGRLIPLKVLDSITIFFRSDHWSDLDDEEMNVWLRDYLKWLTKSKLGKEGAKQTNNHGSWYRFQTTALAFYLGEQKILNRQLKLTKKAMTQQFNREGAQEHELQRTKSFFYSCFNLDAVTRIALIADRAGQSLWDYPTAETSKLVQAVEFLMPTAQGEPWSYPTQGVNLNHFIPVLDRYADQTGAAEHKALLKKLLAASGGHAPKEIAERHVYNRFALFKPDVLD